MCKKHVAHEKSQYSVAQELELLIVGGCTFRMLLVDR